MQRFNVMHHSELEDPFHFILDAEHFGNQCRFVNHSNNAQNVNCAFILRHNFGNCSFPSISEVWCRATKKIEKGNELFVDYGDSYWNNLDIAMLLKQRKQWNEGFVFSHCIMNETEFCSHSEIKRLIERHHAINPLLADQTFPNCIAVKKDCFDGFGVFATKTIKKNTFILRYAGIRKLVTNFDQSKSRYSIQIKH